MFNIKEELRLSLLIERETGQIRAFKTNNLSNSYGEELLAAFEMFYELEYKYNAMLNHPFNGHEKRFNNILEIIEYKAREIISELTLTFINIYSEWVKSHDIENPLEFTESRISDLDGGQILDTIISEYNRYVNNGEKLNQSRVFSEILNEIEQNPGNYPNFFNCFDGLIDMSRDDLRSEFEESGLEDFNLNHNIELSDEDEVEQYISDYEISISDYVYDIETITNYLNEDALIEMYMNLVIPHWYRYWDSYGLSGTVEANKEILDALNNIENEPIKDQFVSFNLATQGVHQTGDMMDYYDNTYSISKQDLDNLSDMDVDDWNNELREIGLNI